jgi:hypothetical protein
MTYPKYKKKSLQTDAQSLMVLGMLYVVDVRLVTKHTQEKIKHRLLLVGCEEPDIERKIRWLFDATKYKEISIKGIEKVREKVHFLSTSIIKLNEPTNPVIEREDGTQTVPQQQQLHEQYDPNLYAVGVTTTMLAKDEKHALRKVGNALINLASEGASHSGSNLSDDSNVQIEQVSKSSGFAKPRDVSMESNKATFVRG